MEQLIYIKSLHRPYNQNLNSVKWVCKFIKHKNSNNEISKSDFYVEFYLYLIKKLYNLYKKNPNESLTHGIPSFDSVKNSYDTIIGISKDKKKKIINESLAKRESEFEKSIFSTYKATSYFINLAKDKLEFVDHNNKLKDIGETLVSYKSNDFKLSKKEKEVLFSSIIKSDFHFFISLSLLQKVQKKVKNLSIEEIHFEFLVEKFNIRHFRYTEASNEKNFSKVREHWIKDLDFLDKNFNVKKAFLDIMFNEGLEEPYKKVKKLVDNYYKEKIVSKSKFQEKIDFFIDIYETNPKNELGFLSLQDIADQMKMGKKSFQNFISEFYESEKNKYNIFFNNVVQAISGKNQYFIRNRPVVNIRIKELNK
ncbi:hypothetical protein EIH07_05350 [Chryseobacterium taklimakanense]|uniref:hypothetical protein n=1 Tax=Chryseobacterium taklimakanense TaxID=536441 RepID=UPI000F5E174E|nr:hypothetical protein [Chryseobacterium taklimakanense]AZI22509.1 hypothetical protein EIH07_05350 [Chryseobacterium taklimakanense]